MKKDYKMYGFAAAAIMFIFGIYLLGHAGANFLQADEAPAAEGELLSVQSIAAIQLFFGILVAIAGIFVFLVFLRKRFDDEI